MEASKHFGSALEAYEIGRGAEDAEDRYAATLGMLRIYDRGQYPTHALKILGVVMLLITLVGGGVLIYQALPRYDYSRQIAPLNQMGLILGLAVTFSGLIWSALLIAAARAVRLLEAMDLRQAAEREARIRRETEVSHPRENLYPAHTAEG